jgi:hypothetical protein
MLSFRISFMAFSGCAAALMLTGCSNSVTNSIAGTGPAPAVANMGVQVNGVAPNRALYVQFNEAMDSSTINGQTVMVKDAGGTAAAGAVTYNATFNIASFQPNPPLQDNASYTLTVTTAVASSQGVHLPSAFNKTFTTRATSDTSPIFVKAVTPSPNATCVSTSTPITITFNEGADINTLTAANIFITGPGSAPIAAKMGYDAGSGTVTLTPSAALPDGLITVTVQNVADAAGQAMASKYAWSFSTACSGGGGSTANTQFIATILDGHGTIHGKVTIDTLGNTTVQLTGATGGATYQVQFCPAFISYLPNPPSCFVVMNSISTDASGSTTQTAKFPQPGDWVGDFNVCVSTCSGSNPNVPYGTYVAQSVANETYLAQLLPEQSVNGGKVTTAKTQDPIISGTVTYSNGSLQFAVKGADPLTKYTGVETETTFMDGSGSYGLNSFTTDAMGNGSMTSSVSGAGGDLFNLDPSDSDAGFMGGFSIPK